MVSSLLRPLAKRGLSEVIQTASQKAGRQILPQSITNIQRAVDGGLVDPDDLIKSLDSGQFDLLTEADGIGDGLIRQNRMNDNIRATGNDSPVKSTLPGFTHNIGSADKKEFTERTANWQIDERARLGGDHTKINRSAYGTIGIDGEEAGISGIGRFFEKLDEAGGDLSKINTKKAGLFDFIPKKYAEARGLLETPPMEEMNAWAMRHDVDPNTMAEYFRFAKRGFASVRAAAKRMNQFDKMPRKWHAGHLTAAATEVPNDAQWLWRSKNSRMGSPPTTGGHATIIELGKDNISGLNRLDHNINPHAAKIADIPLSWEQDLKRFLRIKNGEAYGNYAADWTIAERKIIEAIPYDMKPAEVKAIFKALEEAQKANPKHWRYQAKSVAREGRIDKSREAGYDNPDYYLYGQKPEPEFGDPAAGLEGANTAKQNKAYDTEQGG